MANNQKFIYEEKPHWRPFYADEINVLLEEIPASLEQIKRFTSNKLNKDYVCGFLQEYRNIYIAEICSGENRLICKIKDGQLQTEGLDYRNAMKIKNLSEAITYAFGEKFSAEDENHSFTVMLAKEVNRIIGKGLFSNAGNYRVKEAKLSRYNYYYLNPVFIEDRMSELFEDVIVKTTQDLSITEYIEVAAGFFETFLKIHPFSNGNGRTARILLSALLLKHTYAPISIFSSSFSYTCNNDYVDCLIEAHSHNNNHLLNSLIIESIHRFCHLFLTTLDVEDADF